MNRLDGRGRGRGWQGWSWVLVLSAGPLLGLLGSPTALRAEDHGLSPGAGRMGFGLSFHPGLGYGGCAVGVGTDGGYPFYGGPGYATQGPPLRRFGRIAPFPYQGAWSSGCGGDFRYFVPVEPLIVEPPVARSGVDRRHLSADADFGPFSGVLPAQTVRGR